MLVREREARLNNLLRIWVPAILLGCHIAAYALFSAFGDFDPFELFNVLLIASNIVIAGLLFKGGRDILIGGGIMFLIAMHAFIGQRLAPESLTSGAILMVNILVLYVGIKINQHLPARYWYAFVIGYFALYGIFIFGLENAEALFLLFLMIFTACSRSFKLLSYFWCFTLSFTFFQPFAWEITVVSFFILTALFGAKGAQGSKLSRLFLLVGLVLLFLVFLPIIIAMMGEQLVNIEPVLRDPRIQSAIGLTFITATVSTVILMLFAVPLAYAVSRLRFPGRTVLMSLIDLPVVIPQSVAGIALISVLGRNQFIGELIHRYTGMAIDNTVLGIIVAQVIVALPFITKSSIAAFDAVPQELEVVAKTLKASSFSAFRRVALPLASRGIFFGAVLAWARAAGEFGAVVIIAPTPVTAPVEAYNRFSDPGIGMVETMPLVVVLLLFSFAMFFLLQTSVRLLPSRGDGEEGRAQ